jgi:hypothetical protein
MLVFHFDAALAGTSARGFHHGDPDRALRRAGVVTGEDFTFGKGAAAMWICCAHSARASASTRRWGRSAIGERGGLLQPHPRGLREGDPQLAARLLTRPFAIRGIVEHGDKRGRTIGYPTANIDDRQLPAPALRHLRGDGPGAGHRTAAARARPISASARSSIRPRNCWSRISSIFPAISTGRRSRSPSTTSCAARRSLTARGADGADGQGLRRGAGRAKGLAMRPSCPCGSVAASKRRPLGHVRALTEQIAPRAPSARHD